MQTSSGRTNYVKRMSRVTAYIHDHLDEDIDLASLAEVACLSPGHWHRIYHALYGETAAATVKRLRLQRAAGDLAHSAMPIAEVARRARYSGVAAFTRAFSDVFGQPPATYREQGSHTRFKAAIAADSDTAFPVEIRHREPGRLAAIAHVGAYMEIGRSFDALFTLLGARGLIRPGLRMAGVYLDDPTSLPPETLRAFAGVEVDEGFPIAAPLQLVPLRGGDYAVLRYRGPYADMKAAYDWLYGEWLVGSGREADDAPTFELYLNTPQETPPTELLTEIFLPLRNNGDQSKDNL